MESNTKLCGWLVGFGGDDYVAGKSDRYDIMWQTNFTHVLTSFNFIKLTLHFSFAHGDSLGTRLITISNTAIKKANKAVKV